MNENGQLQGKDPMDPYEVPRLTCVVIRGAGGATDRRPRAAAVSLPSLSRPISFLGRKKKRRDVHRPPMTLTDQTFT
jgi:hypothetical protein